MTLLVHICRQQGPAHDIAAFFMPRRTHVCDKILEDEGVLADVHLGTFPLDFIPFEMDVLSLELPTAFRVGPEAHAVMT